MPEYLHPGVYIEEYDGQPKAIPGVATSTDEFVVRTLANEIAQIVRRAHPDWTDFNVRDPGVTLLDVLAFLSELVLYRSGTLSEQGRRAALRAVGSLSRLTDPCGRGCGTISRPRFFTGQLFDAASLQAEQDYHREKRRRHNRALHGVGIVDGLGVGVEPGGGAEHGRIRIEPGYTIDPCGDEIVLDQGAVLPLPRTGDPIWVTLRHWDRPCSPVPSAAQAEPMHSRIEDACIVSLTGAFASPAIAVARLHASRNGWVVDAAFTPPRVSRMAG